MLDPPSLLTVEAVGGGLLEDRVAASGQDQHLDVLGSNMGSVTGTAFPG